MSNKIQISGIFNIFYLIFSRSRVELVGNLHINMDNLCSFMPQERVGEFSTLKHEELLQQTLKSLVETQLSDEQIDLRYIIL